MLFPGEASQQDLVRNNIRMGKHPEAHSQVHCISHTATSCYDSIPFFTNPFISSSPLHHPFIVSHRSLWLKETVIENRIRSQEDIWLYSYSVFMSVHRILTEIPHVSDTSPTSPPPPKWQDCRGLISTLGILLKGISHCNTIKLFDSQA